jgi:hypothetical protein
MTAHLQRPETLGNKVIVTDLNIRNLPTEEAVVLLAPSGTGAEIWDGRIMHDGLWHDHLVENVHFALVPEFANETLNDCFVFL